MALSVLNINNTLAQPLLLRFPANFRQQFTKEILLPTFALMSSKNP
jgi:hypothetical protein